MTSSKTRAFLATLVSALYLGATMLGFAHLLEQQHAVCLEHGELHHVSPDVSDRQLVDTDEPQLSRHGWAEDDHCDLLHFFQKNSVTIGPAPALTVADADTKLLPLWHRVEARLSSDDTWRYAPKQSPPLAG